MPQSVLGRLRVLIDHNLDAFNASLKGAVSPLNKFGSAATSAGRTLSLGLTAPIVGVGAAAIKLGAEVEEAENLFTVSFGSMADEVRAWSETTSDALGTNVFQIRENAATLFQMLTAMGLADDEAREMAQSLTVLTEDMASFRNLNPADVFQKIQAGITGEAEPLKRLGILINETTIKQAALNQGLIEGKEKLTDIQKVQMRFSELMRQTADDQGDLVRTQDSVTNTMRRMKAEMTEVTAELGVALLPLFSSLLQVVQQLVPVLQAGVDWFTNLSPEMQQVAVVGAAVTAALGPVLVGLGGLATTITTVVIPAVTVVGGALAALVSGAAAPFVLVGAALAGLVVVWVKWGDDITRIVRETIEAIWGFVTGRWQESVDKWKAGIESVTGFFRDMKDKVVGNSIVPDMVDMIGREVARLDTVFVARIQGQLEQVVGSFSGVLSQGLGQIFGGGDVRGSIANMIEQGLGRAMDTLVPGLGRLAGLAMKGLTRLGSAIGGFFRRLFGGPSQAELEGREAANAYIDTVIATGNANADEVAAAIQAGWDPRLAEFAVSLKGMFQEVGADGQVAIDFAQKLFDAIEKGPEAVAAVIAEIMAAIDAFRKAGEEADKAFRDRTMNVKVDVEGDTVDLSGGSRRRGAVAPVAAQHGALVNRPILAGEAGPEAILPLTGGPESFIGILKRIERLLMRQPEHMRTAMLEAATLTPR